MEYCFDKNGQVSEAKELPEMSTKQETFSVHMKVPCLSLTKQLIRKLITDSLVTAQEKNQLHNFEPNLKQALIKY